MGDRGNIVIEKDNQCFTAPLFLYSHWTGSDLGEILSEALKRGKGRWTDPSYLARIIFSEMIRGSVLEETGFGISNMPGDGSGYLWCINIPKQTVRLVHSDNPEDKEIRKWSFNDFTTVKPSELSTD